MWVLRLCRVAKMTMMIIVLAVVVLAVVALAVVVLAVVVPVVILVLDVQVDVLTVVEKHVRLVVMALVIMIALVVALAAVKQEANTIRHVGFVKVLVLEVV